MFSKRSMIGTSHGSASLSVNMIAGDVPPTAEQEVAPPNVRLLVSAVNPPFRANRRIGSAVIYACLDDNCCSGVEDSLGAASEAKHVKLRRLPLSCQIRNAVIAGRRMHRTTYRHNHLIRPARTGIAGQTEFAQNSNCLIWRRNGIDAVSPAI